MSGIVSFEQKYVPWDDPLEVFVWAFAVVITTFLVHNIMRKYKEKRDDA